MRSTSLILTGETRRRNFIRKFSSQILLLLLFAEEEKKRKRMTTTTATTTTTTTGTPPALVGFEFKKENKSDGIGIWIEGAGYNPLVFWGAELVVLPSTQATDAEYARLMVVTQEIVHDSTNTVVRIVPKTVVDKLFSIAEKEDIFNLPSSDYSKDLFDDGISPPPIYSKPSSHQAHSNAYIELIYHSSVPHGSECQSEASKATVLSPDTDGCARVGVVSGTNRATPDAVPQLRQSRSVPSIRERSWASADP